MILYKTYKMNEEIRNMKKDHFKVLDFYGSQIHIGLFSEKIISQNPHFIAQPLYF